MLELALQKGTAVSSLRVCHVATPQCQAAWAAVKAKAVLNWWPKRSPPMRMAGGK